MIVSRQGFTVLFFFSGPEECRVIETLYLYLTFSVVRIRLASYVSRQYRTGKPQQLSQSQEQTKYKCKEDEIMQKGQTVPTYLPHTIDPSTHPPSQPPNNAASIS